MKPAYMRVFALFCFLFFTNIVALPIVEISHSGSGSVALTDVEADTMRNKFSVLVGTASQSSVAYRAQAHRAVDGETHQDFGKKSCTHTRYETNPWWKLDFGAERMVASVEVWNRAKVRSRLSGVQVKVGDSICGTLTSASVQTVSCNKVGSAVTLQQEGGTPLTVCEVKVYGSTDLTIPTAPPTSAPSEAPTEVPTTPQDFNDLPINVCSVMGVFSSATGKIEPQPTPSSSAGKCKQSGDGRQPSWDTRGVAPGIVGTQHMLGVASRGSGAAKLIGYSVPILFIPVSSALASLTNIEISLHFSAVGGYRSGGALDINLVGLGLRDNNDGAVDSDFHVGAGGAGEMIGEVLSKEQTAGAEQPQDVKISSPALLAYAKKMYEEWRAKSDQRGMQYMVLRLGSTNAAGCDHSDENVNGGCRGRRITIDPAKSKVTIAVPKNSKRPSRLVSATCAADKKVTLSYTPDEQGTIIPDFSSVGYRSGNEPLPTVPSPSSSPIVAPYPTLEEAKAGDIESQAEIQAKIEEVGQRPPNSDGIRGVVLLGEGFFRVGQALHINKDGVILRGAGSGKTVLFGTEAGAHCTAAGSWHSVRKCTMILVGSVSPGGFTHYKMDYSNGQKVASTRTELAEDMVVGSTTVVVTEAQASKFKVGDRVAIERKVNAEWVHDLKMDQIANCGPDRPPPMNPRCRQWKASGYGATYERTITGIDGGKLHIDIPIVDASKAKYGGGVITALTDKWVESGRVTNVGIEELGIYSSFKPVWIPDSKCCSPHGHDEEHLWNGVVFQYAEHSWVKDINCKYLAGSCTQQDKMAQFTTVANSRASDFVSEVTGMRRYSYDIGGAMNLVTNCTADHGRHDYVSGSNVEGPNVWHKCTSTNAHADIGPHQRFATGQLYDAIVSDHEFAVRDRGEMGSGHGWAGETIVFWNVEANGPLGGINNDAAITGSNFVVGSIAHHLNAMPRQHDRGTWDSVGAHVFPHSLYDAQLAARRQTPFAECD